MSDAPKGELILCSTEDGRAAIQLCAVDGTVWLTQAEMAAQFDTSLQNVRLHLKNLLEDNELGAAAVLKESLITADGKAYATKLYGLGAILAAGYRVRGPRGSQFRRRAMTVRPELMFGDLRTKDSGKFMGSAT